MQTLVATRSGDTWSVPAASLAPGQYTAQATQAGVRGVDGVSTPLSFRVAGPPATLAGSSIQQASGDRDDDGIPDDKDSSDGSLPPVPGKTFDARVISGEVLVKYPAGAGPAGGSWP